FDRQIEALDIAGFGQNLTNQHQQVCILSGGPWNEITDHRLSRLLRRCRERPRRCAAEQRDELAPLHSITSSAATSSLSGTVRPSILAVSALMTSSNFVDCMTGRSAGFAPLRMRPV